MKTLVIVGVGLLPIYAGPSGLPQPAHAVLFLLSIVVLLRVSSANLPIVAPRLIAAACGLTLWVLFIQVFWILRGADLPLAVPLQFFFNLAVLFGLINALAYDRRVSQGIQTGLYLALCISIGYATVDVLLTGSDFGRLSGPANNPNQYAYIVVCLWASLLLLRKGKTKVPDAILGTLAVLSVFLSASLANVFAVTIIAGSLLVPRMMAPTASRRKLLIVFTGAVSFFLATQFVSLPEQWQFLISRWNRKAPAYVEERRLLLSSGDPLQPMLGAGKGDLGRFFDQTNEIHNSYVDLYFSFGVIGLLLFLSILWLIAKHLDISQRLVLVGVLTYGLSHVGHRTPAFWVFLALLWHSRSGRRKERLFSPRAGFQRINN